MIVDDDKGILDAMEAIYNFEGYDVCAVIKDGGEVLNKLIKVDPDLLVLDVFLSEVDGRKIVSAIKSNEKTKDVPVVMTSARDDVKESALACGASSFIVKPFDVDEILHESEKLLN